MISVTDSGDGMPEAVRQRAFEPFFTTKAAGKETGLGLSQVFGFVKQSSGHVKIYSEEGRGTSVKVYLPRMIGENAEGAVLSPRAGDGPENASETVLAVEDEPQVRETTTAALRQLGYRVFEDDTPSEALRILDAHPEIDLLFTDVVLPEMNGKRLADIATGKRPGLKTLFTTGYTRNAVVHNGIVDPGVAFIAKPFTTDELARKLQDALRGT
jgi:CheY-like chemotaxis protein